jgi:hypothetical protein
MVRVAHALDTRVEIKLVRRKGTKAGRGEMVGESQKQLEYREEFVHGD